MSFLSSDPVFNRTQKRLIAGLLLAAAGVMALAIVGSLAVSAQTASPTAEVPGLDPGEAGNITVEVAWNENATTSDTATVSIDYVVNGSTGELEQTDTHTINASTGETTSGTFEVSPDQNVAYFDVTAEAVDANVSSVTVTSDIEADSGGSGGGGFAPDSRAVGGLIAVFIVLAVIAAARLDS